MDLQLTGCVALVTAASRGLGRASARTLALEGARVAAGARSLQQLAALTEEIRAHGGAGEVLGVALDLTNPASIRSCVRQVLDRWGRLDVLVANTPGPPSGLFTSIDVQTWAAALDVQVLAMVRLLHEVLPVMRAQRSGRVLFITTVGVRAAQPEMVLSNATRLATLGIAKTLSLELAPDNILVNVIAPGPIATDRMLDLVRDTAERQCLDQVDAERVWLAEVPLGRMGRPQDVASVVALLSSDMCSYVTGAVIPVDGGKARGY